jgi:outer membrane protein OmpA-like peptidoglycan-associated protein
MLHLMSQEHSVAGLEAGSVIQREDVVTSHDGSLGNRMKIFGWAAAIAGAVWLLAGAGAALAQSPSEAEILEALRSSHSRAPTASSEQQNRDAEERRLIESLINRTARSITQKDRANIEKLAESKPSVDIEITFDYNSDVIGAQAVRQLLALGRALSNDQLKGTIFLVNGHTDAKGNDEYNQSLSERRAEAVKRVLIEQFNLPASALIAVGHGKAQLKNTSAPFAAENRRVQIVNTEQQVAAGGR